MRAPKLTRHKEIEGLLSFKLDSFQDHRGLNAEIYSFYKNKLPVEHWNLDSFSVSRKGVLRGAHYCKLNNKLIQILYGKVQFVLLDNRNDSPTFNNVKEFIVDYLYPVQFFVPFGVANLHLVLSDSCVFYYKWDKGYCKQETIKWTDPRFKHIKWRFFNGCPILSERDK